MATESLVKVYSGLSVGADDVARVLPNAVFSGPIERGDAPRDAASGVGVLVIIDGRFVQSHAVSPGELMDALRRGVRIYGSSSMGALRAAELEPYGMIGHGRIFDLIKRTPAFSDDHLGLTFHEDTLRPISVPYVDLHFALEDMRARGEVTRASARHVLEAFGRLPFPDRDPRFVAELLERTHGRRGKALAEIARRALASAQQKRTDGLALLERVKRDLEHIESVHRTLDQTLRPIQPLLTRAAS